MLVGRGQDADVPTARTVRAIERRQVLLPVVAVALLQGGQGAVGAAIKHRASGSRERGKGLS